MTMTVMTASDELKVGWMHHLARHAVACFLTRGDLWLSWEEGSSCYVACICLGFFPSQSSIQQLTAAMAFGGRDVFDKLLVDAASASCGCHFSLFRSSGCEVHTEDWSLNNMNWLGLSGAAPWSPPFFRIYHPVRNPGGMRRSVSVGVACSAGP